MYLVENPVLQRELLVNLRTHRSFLLLLVYQAVLATVVFFAWPAETRLEANATAARRLVNFFFLGQYVLAALMTPAFAAGAITGEKERKTYEMLLASPMRPGAIVLGKLIASLTHLAILIFCSLPIVMLCLPLGGVSLYEILAAYLGLALSVVTFGMISMACSSYFRRTMSALVASYLLILPLAMLAVLAWNVLAETGRLRLFFAGVVLPAFAAPLCIMLFQRTSRRLLYPPDVGSEGKEVVDIEREAEEVVGLVIQRDKFPDRLFAPPKRVELLADHANPVYDKEIHSEIFSQGTLMLRLVIQVSMFLAIPIMAFCLFIAPGYSPWYIAYVLLFNMLVGPVFCAGAVTSERERQTLDLLLTTTITPWQILGGKLIAGLRVSTVLTLFLVWPLFLACVIFLLMSPVSQDNFYWVNLKSIGAFMVIILCTCLTTAILAMFCSVLFRQTSVSLMTSYIALAILFCLPLAVSFFVATFYPNQVDQAWNQLLGITSPFATTFSIPLKVDTFDTAGLPPPRSALDDGTASAASWHLFFAYLATLLVLVGGLFAAMIRLFETRWRVAQ
jgi:ABC-type transport system involved in multi-copper enzyme maturation permease subunit